MPSNNDLCVTRRFAGKAISLDGAAVVSDRLGSVVSRAGSAVDYFPYGEEKTTTANPAEKFGTYLRDATGLDYAEQRYFHSAGGAFLSTDPVGTDAVVNTEPLSWNMYTYSGGDPINFNDPDGTTACGDLNILGTGMSLRSAVTAQGDTALLANLVWAESSHVWATQGSANYFAEQDAIAWTVVNRWRILNGQLSIAGVSNPSTLGWGGNYATISQIIGWNSPTQFATISGGPNNPQLNQSQQTQLNGILASEPSGADTLTFTNLGGLPPVSMTHGCYDVWQSWVTASSALSRDGTSKDTYASNGYTTSFHYGSATTPLETFFGSLGSRNNYFGIKGQDITVNPDPVVLPFPRKLPPPKKKGGVGRRGVI